MNRSKKCSIPKLKDNKLTHWILQDINGLICLDVLYLDLDTSTKNLEQIAELGKVLAWFRFRRFSMNGFSISCDGRCMLWALSSIPFLSSRASLPPSLSLGCFLHKLAFLWQQPFSPSPAHLDTEPRSEGGVSWLEDARAGAVMEGISYPLCRNVSIHIQKQHSDSYSIVKKL